MRWYCVHPSLPTQAELRVRAAPDGSAPERARLAQGQVLAVCAPAIETPSVDADAAPLTWLPVALADEEEQAYVLSCLPDGTGLLAPWETAGFQRCCNVARADAQLFDGPAVTCQSLGQVESVQFPYGVVEVVGSRARIAHPEHESAWIDTSELQTVCATLRHADCTSSHSFFTLNETLPAEAQIAIRAFPSKEAETVGLLSRGEILEATTRSGNWLQVADSGENGMNDGLWIMWHTGALELLVEVPEESSSQCQRPSDDQEAERVTAEEATVVLDEMETSPSEEGGEPLNDDSVDAVSGAAPASTVNNVERPSELDAKDKEIPSVDSWDDRPLNVGGGGSGDAKDGLTAPVEDDQGEEEELDAEEYEEAVKETEEAVNELGDEASGLTPPLATEDVTPADPVDVMASWDDRPIRPLRTQDQCSWDEYPLDEQGEAVASNDADGLENEELGEADEDVTGGDMNGAKPGEDAAILNPGTTVPASSVETVTDLPDSNNNANATNELHADATEEEHEDAPGTVASWDDMPVGGSAARGAVHAWDEVPVGPRSRKKENHASAWTETPAGSANSHSTPDPNETGPAKASIDEDAANEGEGNDEEAEEEQEGETENDAEVEDGDKAETDEGPVDTDASVDGISDAVPSATNTHAWDDIPVGPRRRLKDDNSAAWEDTPVGSHGRTANLHGAISVVKSKPTLPLEDTEVQEDNGTGDVINANEGDMVDDDDEAPASDRDDESIPDMEIDDQQDEGGISQDEVDSEEDEVAPSPSIEDEEDSTAGSVELAEETGVYEEKSPASSVSSVAKLKPPAESAKKSDGILYLMQFGMGAYCRRKQAFITSSDELSQAMYDAQAGDSDIVLQALVGDDPLCDEWFRSVSSKVLQAASQPDSSKFLDVLDSHDRENASNTSAKISNPPPSAAKMFAVPPSSLSVALEEKIDSILHRSPVKPDSMNTYDLIMGDADADAILEAELDVDNEGDFDLLSSFSYPEPKRRTGVPNDSRTMSFSRRVPSSSSSATSVESEASVAASAAASVDGNGTETEVDDDAASSPGSESSQDSVPKQSVSAIAKLPSPRATRAATVSTPPRTPTRSRLGSPSSIRSSSIPPTASGLPQRQPVGRTSGIAKPGGSLLRPRSSTSATSGTSSLLPPSASTASPSKPTRSILPRKSMLPTPSPTKTRVPSGSSIATPSTSTSAIPGLADGSSGLQAPRRMSFGFRRPTTSPKK